MPQAYSKICCNLPLTILCFYMFLSIFAYLYSDYLYISFLDLYTLPTSSLSSSSSFYCFNKIYSIFLQLLVIGIHLYQNYLQRIPLYSNLLQILVVLLYVVGLMFGYLQFCQYIIILILLHLKLCFELLLLLQILNIFILLLYYLFIFVFQIRESKQNVGHLCIVRCYLLKHTINSFMFIEFYFQSLHKPWCMKSKNLSFGTNI